GKRTTTTLLLEQCRREGLRTEWIYTGQTGWLQGAKYGFLLDATPNDFVSGELEGAVLECARETNPDLILLEGQSALRNPSGPCGAELILSGGARGVVLQHAPGRKNFEGMEGEAWKIPSLREEIELIGLLGAEVWAVTLNGEGLGPGAERVAKELADELGIPVVLPLDQGVGEVVAAFRAHIATDGR
ncbi:MAG: NAD-dependent epimerase/dehydratase family protein, partial [Acidobacteria bacterium]|nr:NAD-dependent epimerase/dehydratase family protein [Acidobacteriota bacterium]